MKGLGFMKKSFCIGILFCLVSHAASAEVGAYYRYKDEKGDVVISRSIPTHKVKNGYEVLSSAGRVIEVVNRALTGKELSEQSAQNKQALSAKALKTQQREYDLQLLRRYSFVGDIESEKKRKVREMSVRVQILKGNLLSVRNELEVAYEQAAKVEQRGSKVSERKLKHIAGLEQKLMTTEQLMKKLQGDMEATRREYLLAIERFKELKAIK